MAEIANVIIIGGGVVGTAIAAEISRQQDDVFLLEAQPRLGLGASTRNSGVIHGGMYYQKNSAKAFHCVRGARMLYEFCAEHRVPHQRMGKLIVADEINELPALEDLKKRGDENGVEDLAIVDAAFIKQREPNVASPLALHSPNTGIVEAEALLKTLARLATENGAYILTDTRVLAIESKPENLIALRTSNEEEILARVVINAAGLFSDEIAKMIGYDEHTIYPCRGEYAELPPRLNEIVNGLIYPLPPASGHGLGVHFTKNIAGTVLLGPNANYVNSKDDYENNRSSLDSFYESAVKIVPQLQREDLRLSYTGIRARLRPAHDHRFADFVIKHDDNFPNIIHLIGIESPGLTSCLSIAQTVGEMLRY